MPLKLFMEKMEKITLLRYVLYFRKIDMTYKDVVEHFCFVVFLLQIQPLCFILYVILLISVFF